MVGVGRERSEPPSLAHARRYDVIPPQHLQRALVDSMQTLAGASSSVGRGRGKMMRGARGGRGGGRGRKAATPSSPPPLADSPDHMITLFEVDPFDEDPSRTLVHEPRADEP